MQCFALNVVSWLWIILARIERNSNNLTNHINSTPYTMRAIKTRVVCGIRRRRVAKCLRLVAKYRTRHDIFECTVRLRYSVCMCLCVCDRPRGKSANSCWIWFISNEWATRIARDVRESLKVRLPCKCVCVGVCWLANVYVLVCSLTVKWVSFLSYVVSICYGNTTKSSRAGMKANARKVLVYRRTYDDKFAIIYTKSEPPIIPNNGATVRTLCPPTVIMTMLG